MLIFISNPIQSAVTDVLQVGQWVAVSNNTIADVDPCPARDCSYSAVSGQSAVIDDWNGGAFASGYAGLDEQNTLGGLVVWGGGHRGYYGNEIYVFNLQTQNWERVTDPVNDPVCDFVYGEYQGGSPCTAHTYDYVDYDPATNSFVMLGSASLHDKGGTGAEWPHLFDFDTKTWIRGETHSLGGLEGASSAYDAKRGLFWVLPAYDKILSSYDPSAPSGSQWTEYYRFNIPIDAVTEIDPVRDLLVTLEHRESGNVYVHDLNNPNAGATVVNLVEGSANAFDIRSQDMAGLAWDPVNQFFVAWAGGPTIYTLTPPPVGSDWKTENWTWDIAILPNNTVDPGTESANGTYGRFRYASTVNAFIVISGVDRPVYMIKLSDGNPLPVIQFSASRSVVDVGESVTLQWSVQGASTCLAQGDWDNNKPTQGSEILQIDAPQSFILWCQDANGIGIAKQVNVRITTRNEVPATNARTTISTGNFSEIFIVCIILLIITRWFNSED